MNRLNQAHQDLQKSIADFRTEFTAASTSVQKALDNLRQTAEDFRRLNRQEGEKQTGDINE